MIGVPIGRVVLIVASVGALALLARSLIIAPVPLWVVGVVFFGYLAVAVGGALAPQLGMYADVLWRGEPGARGVALTFDDGPDPRTTPRVLHILERARVRATFFVIGHKVDQHPDVVRAIAEAGHEIGVHGYAHDRLYALKPPAAVAGDIAKTVDAVGRAAGVRPRWFRPPIGQVSPRTAEGAKRAGLPIVAWSVRARDGLASANPDSIKLRVTRGLRDGAIVLLHDAREHGDGVPASIEALPSILRALEARGLSAVTLDELVNRGEA